jgi:translation initiation factor 2B subunit (eIF-2B alpha/beta/delta family)
MDASSPFDTLVAPLRADVRSGAADIARSAARVMARAASELDAGGAAALREALSRVGLRVLEAQPAMAPLVALVRDVLQAADPRLTLAEARRAAAGAAAAFRAGLEARAPALAARTAALLPERGDVLTLSRSSSVREALLHRGATPGRRVVVLESRPMNEGRALAAELAEAGVPVLYAVDAAATELARRSSTVLLGADSIGDAGVVNKLGSRGLARAAADAGVPVLVVADETKLLPPGFPQTLGDDRPAGDVWEAPPGVEVWNRYFEAVSLDAVTSVVTAGGALDREEVERLRGSLDVPDELRAWATRRSGGRPDSTGP